MELFGQDLPRLNRLRLQLGRHDLLDHFSVSRLRPVGVSTPEAPPVQGLPSGV
jgi:hypothetical protein